MEPKAAAPEWRPQTRWELVELLFSGWKHDSCRVRWYRGDRSVVEAYAPAPEHARWDQRLVGGSEVLNALIARLAWEGWELVTDDDFRMWFKRPVSEGAPDPISPKPDMTQSVHQKGRPL